MKEPFMVEIAVDTARLQKAIDRILGSSTVTVKNTTRKPIPAGATVEVRRVRNQWRITDVVPPEPKPTP
jgi:hypothetical protein